jgi:hypothetical protein
MEDIQHIPQTNTRRCILTYLITLSHQQVEDLGFSLVQDQNGEYLISYVLAGSLASEYEKMHPGDVIKVLL